MSVKYPGFTKRQREYFLRRDESKCQMPILKETANGGERFGRCGSTKKPHIHHIIPRGWASAWIHSGWQVNQATNGITLCERHHVGYGMKIEEALTWSIHPDMEIARKRAGASPATFGEMFLQREERTKKGLPYWNTQFDFLLQRIANQRTEEFAEAFPERCAVAPDYASDWMDDMIRLQWQEIFEGGQ